MRRSLLILAPLLLIAAGVAGWWWFSRETFTPPPPWTEDMQAVANGNNPFALDLYAKLRDQKGNLFFSPYSAHTALAMTATGARGVTRDQMVKVLHLPADEQKVLASGDLCAFYTHPRPDFKLSVANALWGQKDYPWRPEFLELQKKRFGSAFQEADFKGDPDGERQRINKWSEEQTRGKIKELLAEGNITPDTRVVLANAIYFKGDWHHKFDRDETQPMPFTLADGTKVDVPMMRREGVFRHSFPRAKDGHEPLQIQIAELPYKGGELSMVVLLPRKYDGLPALEAKLTAESLAEWLADGMFKETSLHLPKFRIETPEMMLKEPLRQLGMVAPFDPNAADFTGLHTGSKPLFVDAVVQKAFVDVNEEGTEGAAATAIETKKSEDDRPPRLLNFHANRPFLFLIRDVKHGTILFMGRVMHPKE